MIVSVSRRTDIPALYSRWFYQRIMEGYAMVGNPFNSNQVRRVDLLPETVDCFVFWTRYPEPMIPRLDRLQNYTCYFLITLTGYGPPLEPCLPVEADLIASFVHLSQIIGPERILWRYDPIIISDRFTVDTHIKRFSRLAARLAPHCSGCVISFLDMYRKCRARMRAFSPHKPESRQKQALFAALADICSAFSIPLRFCADELAGPPSGVETGGCIDPGIIQRIGGRASEWPKDRTQRKNCRCVKSIDIGSYDTCTHGCLYCYANRSPRLSRQNRALHRWWAERLSMPHRHRETDHESRIAKILS